MFMSHWKFIYGPLISFSNLIISVFKELLWSSKYFCWNTLRNKQPWLFMSFLLQSKYNKIWHGNKTIILKLCFVILLILNLYSPAYIVGNSVGCSNHSKIKKLTQISFGLFCYSFSCFIRNHILLPSLLF